MYNWQFYISHADLIDYGIRTIRLLGSASTVLLIAWILINSHLAIFFIDNRKKANWRQKLFVILLFGIFTNYNAITFVTNGDSIRIIGPIMAGFTAGPIIGALTGILGCFATVLEKIWFDDNSYGVASNLPFIYIGLITIFAGLLAGLYKNASKLIIPKVSIAFIFAFAYEFVVIKLFMVITNYEYAFEMQNTVPTSALASGIALAAFAAMINFQLQEKYRMEQKCATDSEIKASEELYEQYYNPQINWNYSDMPVEACVKSQKMTLSRNIFYDWQIVDNKLCLVFGKTSSDGLVTTMTLSAVKAIFRLSMQQYQPQKAVLKISDLWKTVLGHESSLNIFIAVYNKYDGKLEFANAGFPCPWIRRADGSTKVLTACAGKKISRNENAKFVFSEIILGLDDILIVHDEMQQNQQECVCMSLQQQNVLESLDTKNELTIIQNNILQSDSMYNFLVLIRFKVELDVALSDTIIIDSLKIELRGYHDELNELHSQIKKLSLRNNLPARQLNSIRLMMEEIVVNAMDYGITSRPINHSLPVIILLIEITTLHIRLTISWQGIPFNPLSDSPKPGSKSIGGWGIHLVKSLADRMEYKHDQIYNILIMSKNIEKDQKLTSDKKE